MERGKEVYETRSIHMFHYSIIERLIREEERS